MVGSFVKTVHSSPSGGDFSSKDFTVQSLTARVDSLQQSSQLIVKLLEWLEERPVEVSGEMFL